MYWKNYDVLTTFLLLATIGLIYNVPPAELFSNTTVYYDSFVITIFAYDGGGCYYGDYY